MFSRCHSLLVSAAVLSCCLFSACSTNNAQKLMEPYNKCTGAEFDYREIGLSGKRRLPAVIYRSGKNWYMAAETARMEHSPLADAELRRVSAPVVQYHKITPRLANHLLYPFGKGDISAESLRKELNRAGGGWVSSLPKDARPVQAPYLMAENRTVSWAVVDERAGKMPWYMYPDVAFAFTVFDLPGYAVGTALVVAASPFVIPLYGVSLYQKNSKKELRFIDEIRIPAPGAPGRYLTPQDIGQSCAGRK